MALEKVSNMSFESSIPNHLKELGVNRQLLIREQANLLHDCDCVYCDRDEVDEEDEEEYESLTTKITAINKTIVSVKAHAKLHKIEIPV